MVKVGAIGTHSDTRAHKLIHSVMQFRRSVKSDKHDSAKPVQISIPQKDAIAIEPPKKVIKALYDYRAPTDSPDYLSFSAGDFLHVVAREDDTDWYEACNPLQGTRGLVPVKYFGEIGKTVRDSAGSTRSTGSATHDSGYAEGARSVGASRSSTMMGQQYEAPTSAPGGHRTSKSVGRAGGGVYGIVSYDFQAERPDELDAKEGEAIIVIAQSNPEWFVAKPITRLGGPGLIPVSFIEIRDAKTGLAAEDSAAAVAAAGIPRVEEWKKMAAEYKNTSIPLGTVTSSQQGMGGLSQGMDRMSLASNGHQPNGHQRTPSQAAYQQQQEQTLFAPMRASVPRYIFADDKFHFIVECRLADGSHWDLSRIYEDFYELQINLINAFPEEAGQVAGKPRILPYMPGPVKFVTDNISEGRRVNLDEYLRDLLRLQPHITGSSLVRTFFSRREGDYEVDPGVIDLNDHARPIEQQQQRYSASSQNSYNTAQPQIQHNHSQSYSRNQGQGSDTNLHTYSQSQSSNAAPASYAQHQRQQQSLSSARGQPPPQQPQQQNHYRSPSAYTTHSQTTTTQTTTTLRPQQNSASAPVKVKAWFDRDTCVVLRMAGRNQFNFHDLYRKIVERRRLEFNTGGAAGGYGEEDEEELEIEYRDETDGEYYRLEGDEDLEIALERNEKLTLAVRAAGE
ncbi:hypothetical protein MBLNU230_g3241t1 [Neophaeotheca triangularis]